MKSLGVLFVAVMLLSGCGVGYDDAAWTDDGEPAAASQRQTLEQAVPIAGEPGEPAKGTDPQENSPATQTGYQGGVDLPQDPIPLYQQHVIGPAGQPPLGAPGTQDPRLPPQPLPGR